MCYCQKKKRWSLLICTMHRLVIGFIKSKKTLTWTRVHIAGYLMIRRNYVPLQLQSSFQSPVWPFSCFWGMMFECYGANTIFYSANFICFSNIRVSWWSLGWTPKKWPSKSLCITYLILYLSTVWCLVLPVMCVRSVRFQYILVQQSDLVLWTLEIDLIGFNF